MQNNNRPVHSFRYGNVSCAVWAEETQAGHFWRTTLARVYKDGDTWGESQSFDDRDLPHVMKAAADAHSWIYRQKARAAEAKSTAGDAEIPGS
jgi:hypothetical protein